MPSSLIVGGRLWWLDDAETSALLDALSHLEARRAASADGLVEEITRSGVEAGLPVDVDEDERIGALYVALVAAESAGGASDTITQLRLAAGQRLSHYEA
jgi:hypothetical protein